MIKLKEGQKVLGEDGNFYEIEKGDTLVESTLEEKNNDLYAVYKAKDGRVYLYDEWFEKPVDYTPVTSEKEAIFVATKKWGIPLNKVRVNESLEESTLEENFGTRSDIGSGYADIYRGKYVDSLSVFKNVDEVFVAKDLDSGIEMSLKGKPVVLVTNAYKDVLRAYPIVDGEIVNGMWDGSFVYTSNGVVMKGYSHPIRLMARVE